MTQHAERFTGRVAEYERYRLRYPALVMDVLRERCGLRPEWVIADVGAGTGMLAELFLAAGNEVIAIEPNAEMREACERLTGLRAVDAAAEATGLEAGSVDVVSAGRAFHWFDRQRALAEFARVLRPGGWIVLVTNRRAQEGSERAMEYERILLEHGTDYAAVRGGYRSYEDVRVGGFVERIVGEERMTLEEFVGQTQSLSIAPLPGAAGYEGMQGALREFFARWSMEGVLLLETVCELVGWQVAA